MDTSFVLNGNYLVELGVPIDRHSSDEACNNYGYRLIEMCKSLNIHIGNGKCGEDIFIGDFTTIKKSVIDYVLFTPELFTFVIYLL